MSDGLAGLSARWKKWAALAERCSAQLRDHGLATSPALLAAEAHRARACADELDVALRAAGHEGDGR